MDMSSITAAINCIRFIKDTLYDLREELFRLQSENQDLRQQLKAQKDWQTQKSQYQLEKTAGGAMVYAFTGTPQHYACPSCFAKEVIQILQDRRVMAGVFDCPGCKADYPVNPY